MYTWIKVGRLMKSINTKLLNIIIRGGVTRCREKDELWVWKMGLRWEEEASLEMWIGNIMRA